ncbi:MAG: TlyA family RNA methyltransferase [Deltaproteobacteria bacterium]|nr:TlyA family RNA methyltransferase [Deltaproteobacteria bacterium]
MKKPPKVRIDTLLFEKGLVGSRQKAQALIMAGKVLVNGEMVDKAGKEVNPESLITLKEEVPFVSRGGIKLTGALDKFNVVADGLVIMDVGSSTGGFTDCLLKRGAKKIFAIDVGKGILDISLRNDPRVCVLEEKNIRYMDFNEVGERVDMAVIDVSFISLEKVLPKVKEFLKEGGLVLALIKPQFEVGKGQVGKGGIVKDPEKHKAVIDRITEFAEGEGYKAIGHTESPITGAKGNKEFWILLSA